MASPTARRRSSLAPSDASAMPARPHTSGSMGSISGSGSKSQQRRRSSGIQMSMLELSTSTDNLLEAVLAEPAAPRRHRRSSSLSPLDNCSLYTEVDLSDVDLPPVEGRLFKSRSMHNLDDSSARMSLYEKLPAVGEVSTASRKRSSSDGKETLCDVPRRSWGVLQPIKRKSQLSHGASATDLTRLSGTDWPSPPRTAPVARTTDDLPAINVSSNSPDPDSYLNTSEAP
eukprot:m.54343 g.54343  ORF g.54343 m.54343 type:complete len:229 (-) comp6837_c1_seq1:188-874(-)